MPPAATVQAPSERPTPAPAPQQRQAAAAPGKNEINLPSDVLVPEVRTAIVTRGDSLWRISRRIYGQGLRYTVIYAANQGQIADPDLIYPGQTFVLPGERL